MKWLKDYFDLSRKEQAGFIGLLGIMAGLFGLQFFIIYFVPSKKTDFSNLSGIARQLQAGDTALNPAKENVLPGPKKPLKVPVDLNTADSVKLITIKGIGPAFASRIINFRRKIGCFVDVAQLTDIHGIGPEKYGILKPQVCLSKGHPKYININHASVNELVINPYIGFKLANAIVQFRTSHGRYSSVEDLKKRLAIDEATWQKIVPYLTI